VDNTAAPAQTVLGDGEREWREKNENQKNPMNIFRLLTSARIACEALKLTSKNDSNVQKFFSHQLGLLSHRFSKSF
jgi:hypothetical protein